MNGEVLIVVKITSRIYFFNLLVGWLNSDGNYYDALEMLKILYKHKIFYVNSKVNCYINS